MTLRPIHKEWIGFRDDVVAIVLDDLCDQLRERTPKTRIVFSPLDPSEACPADGLLSATAAKTRLEPPGTTMF
jgi:hypothetical protein